MRTNELRLPGLPALRCCYVAFHMDAAGRSAAVVLDGASFASQRSLQELALRGISGNIYVVNLGWYLIGLPALRFLNIQNLGVTNLKWLQPSWDSVPAGPVHNLNLDYNAALQLDGEAAVSLLAMTGLQKLSMRKRGGQSDASVSNGAAGEADFPPLGAVWSADSMRCIARVSAARPDLQLTF